MSSSTLEESLPIATAQIVVGYLQHRQQNGVLTEEQLMTLIENVGAALKKPHSVKPPR